MIRIKGKMDRVLLGHKPLKKFGLGYFSAFSCRYHPRMKSLVSRLRVTFPVYSSLHMPLLVSCALKWGTRCDSVLGLSKN